MKFMRQISEDKENHATGIGNRGKNKRCHKTLSFMTSFSKTQLISSITLIKKVPQPGSENKKTENNLKFKTIK